MEIDDKSDDFDFDELWNQSTDGASGYEASDESDWHP